MFPASHHRYRHQSAAGLRAERGHEACLQNFQSWAWGLACWPALWEVGIGRAQDSGSCHPDGEAGSFWQLGSAGPAALSVLPELKVLSSVLPSASRWDQLKQPRARVPAPSGGLPPSSQGLWKQVECSSRCTARSQEVPLCPGCTCESGPSSQPSASQKSAAWLHQDFRDSPNQASEGVQSIILAQQLQPLRP